MIFSMLRSTFGVFFLLSLVLPAALAAEDVYVNAQVPWHPAVLDAQGRLLARSEEHTSELQSLRHLVCRLLLEKKTEKHESAPSTPAGSGHESTRGQSTRD